ncbi:MAG: exodeoxyribonuclease VII small subunit [Deltaproteobacteria bacterium]
MKKELSYSEAYNELQLIASDLEKGKYEIDELSEKIKRAAELVSYCKTKLRQIEENVNEVMNSQK